MIRALTLILGLLIGLCAAVAVGGRAAHLRLIAGEGLPGWIAGLDTDAGLLRGEGALAGGRLRWHLDAIDRAGPRWAVVLAGADWQVTASARVGFDGLRVTDVQGLLPGGVLAGGVLAGDGGGVLAVRGGVLALPGIDGWIEGRANALTLNAAAEPVSGDVRLQARGGVWTLEHP